jgi:hypothetical protein
VHAQFAHLLGYLFVRAQKTTSIHPEGEGEKKERRKTEERENITLANSAVSWSGARGSAAFRGVWLCWTTQASSTIGFCNFFASYVFVVFVGLKRFVFVVF